MVDFAFAWERTVSEFWTLLQAPLKVPELWWIVAPLIVSLLLMTFYFGKYFKEQMGWNTSLGNSIVLFFVGIDLLRNIANFYSPPAFHSFLANPVLVVLVLFVMLEGVFLARSAFLHRLPRKFMFFVTSPLSINLQAYILVAMVYARLRPSIYTLFAGLMLFAILFVILRLVQEVQHLALGYHFKSKKRSARKKASGRT